MKKPEMKKTYIAGIFMALFLVAYAAAGQKIAFENPPAPLSPENPKIASSVNQSIKYMKSLPEDAKKAYASNKKSPVKLENYPCKVNDKGEIQVYIYMNTKGKAATDRLAKKGIKVDYTSDVRNLVQAYVPIDRLDEISKMSEVNLITLPSYAISFTGAVRPESVKTSHLNTDQLLRELNIDTSKVNVGVLSTGVGYTWDPTGAYQSSLANGDIITSNTVGNWHETFIGYPNSYMYSSGLETLAMMEIIADIAPRVNFFTADFETDIEMIYAKKWLAGENITGAMTLTDPCDIIVDDIGFFTAGPLNGESEISQATGYVLNKGVAYYTSIGNLAEYHYMANFTDIHQPNGIHEYSYDTNLHKTDEALEARFESVGTARILLQWESDDPAGAWSSSHDLDLYILDPETMDFNNPIAVSNTVQNGNTPPYEFIALTATDQQDFKDIAIVVRKKNSSDNYAKRFHVFMYPLSNIEYIVPESSMINNNEAKCISVGAIDAGSKTRDRVESFSSMGPTDDGRIKPEICSYDGVATSVDGFLSFFGTSAASPHVAGIAALMLAINPSLTYDEMNQKMFESAYDLYIPGDPYYIEGGADMGDIISGYGRLEGYSMLRKLYYDSFTAGLVPAVRYQQFTFDKQNSSTANPAEKWVTQFVNLLSPAYTSADNGELILKARNNSNCYGSWVSPTIQFANTESGTPANTLKPGKIYEATFFIRTDAGPDNFPTFRIRMGAINNVYSSTKVYNSVDNNKEYPGAKGRQYSIQFIPPASTYSDGLYLAVDMMNFNPKDKADASLFISDVVVVEKELTF